MIAPALLLVALAPTQGAAAPAVELPAGALRSAFEARAGALPSATAPWPAWPEAESWSGAATPGDPFERWVALVAGLRAGTGDTARQRADLARLAIVQGRPSDAWQHLAKGGSTAGGWIARRLPALLPGAPPDHPVQPNGLPAPLPAGCVLAPALPPAGPAGHVVNGRILASRMEVRGFELGAATLRLSVSLEPDGVQVDVEHLGGGPARMSIRLPVLDGYAVGAAYVDWERQDDPLADHVLEVQAGDEVHTLWGRFLSKPAPWPLTLPAALPDAVKRAGIVIESPAGDPGAALAARAAAALGALLEVPARGGEPGAGHAVSPLRPLTISLEPAPAGPRKLTKIMSQVEAWLL